MMAHFAVVAFLLLVGSLADSALPVNPETKVVEYKSPVQRVVALLNKMKAELEHEAKKEAQMYDEMVCWCETNEKEKQQAIADADSKDKELSGEIESRAARFGKLSTEIKALKEQVGEDTEAEKQAQGIREKEAGSFREGEKDLVQTITNLKNAISILGRHQGGSSLLQMKGTPMITSVRALLRDAAAKYDLLLGNARVASGGVQTALVQESTAEQRLSTTLLGALDASGASSDELPLKFAQRLTSKSLRAAAPNEAAFLQASQPADFKSYSARSDGIFGVMNQMLSEFEEELARMQKDESKSTGDYKELSAAKAEQLKVGKEKLDELEAEDAENQKALSDAKEDLELTRKQRAADVEFLQNLQTTCNDLDAQWEQRSKTRSEELTAVAETIAIITEDDSRELLSKAVTLVQIQSKKAMANLRSRAAATLRQAAQAPSFDTDDLLSAWDTRHAPAVGAAAGPRTQLSSLAAMVQLDSFTKVKAMMDKMVSELKTEQEEEVKFKAHCVKELDLNEKDTYKKNEEREDLEATIEKLTNHVKKLGKEIADAKKHAAETQVGVKRASENREAENAEFQSIVSDQRATQEILKKALARLKDFYKKKEEAALLQASADQTPPVQFNKFKQNAGASPVMGMIEQIIGDSAALEKEATAGESKAQADYETFVKDSNALLKELSEAISAKTKAIGSAKLETADAKGDHESTVDELESLADVANDLHSECDWVMKNFEIRQKARLQEIEAIGAAKAILSGAK